MDRRDKRGSSSCNGPEQNTAPTRKFKWIRDGRSAKTEETGRSEAVKEKVPCLCNSP